MRGAQALPPAPSHGAWPSASRRYPVPLSSHWPSFTAAFCAETGAFLAATFCTVAFFVATPDASDTVAVFARTVFLATAAFAGVTDGPGATARFLAGARTGAGRPWSADEAGARAVAGAAAAV